jgi:hypothetical protein
VDGSELTRSGTITATRSRVHLGCAAVLAAVYAVPLFCPPGPAMPASTPGAGMLARLFPGVPPLWVAVRLAALALAAVLLGWAPGAAPHEPFAERCPQDPFPTRRTPRGLALGVAVLQLFVAPWAAHLGPAGQAAYLPLLFAPAALLALSRPGPARQHARGGWHGPLATGALIALWVAMRLATDLGTARASDAVDGWRGIFGLVRFDAHRQNLLTDLWDPDLPGLGAIPLFFMGAPVFLTGLLPFDLHTAQVFEIAWLAATAAGIGVLARTVVGPKAAPIAVAVFLFAPYTRFVAVLPGPFLAGSLYATALALAALAAHRRRSEAGLAALGALSGMALTFPAVIPVAFFLDVVTLWTLRRHWRRIWVGGAAGLAVFLAVLVPAVPKVLAVTRMGQHLGAHGSATLLEPALLGQAPVGTFALARTTMVPHPVEIVGAALVEAFVNPRTPIRLWGDAIFDPLGTVLLAVGLVAALRRVGGSAAARFQVLLFVVALSPAFVSPVDRVDIVHAAALPVPVALLAALGFDVVGRKVAVASLRARSVPSATAAVVLIAAGGTLLFDVVNPRILPASAPGIMFQALGRQDTGRVVVLDYPSDYAIDVRWLFTGILSAYGGLAPVGYLRYDGRALPGPDLTAEGTDLLFWSPGLEADLHVREAVCHEWPGATLYEIRDEAGLGRTLAARIGDAPWMPALPAPRWQARACHANAAMPTRPAGFHGAA